MGDLTIRAPLLQIHSQRFTSKILGSLRCDCGDQLEIARQAIAGEGRGLIIYGHQEARGIGRMAKLRSYAPQDARFDIRSSKFLGYFFEKSCTIMLDLILAGEKESW